MTAFHAKLGLACALAGTMCNTMRTQVAWHVAVKQDTKHKEHEVIPFFSRSVFRRSGQSTAVSTA